jgi:predicted ATPase
VAGGARIALRSGARTASGSRGVGGSGASWRAAHGRARARHAAKERPKKLLLILDNCEHLVEAAARLVDSLLDSCPRLRILAASREALDVQGELRWPLPPLSGPDPQRPPTLEELEQSESARLFAERVRRRDPAFSLSPQNATAVAEICQRLEGIPLAIELSAARVGTLSVEQISERLEDSLKLLTRGGRMTVRRQQTLRGALDWSHDLLFETERTLFKRSRCSREDGRWKPPRRWGTASSRRGRFQTRRTRPSR